MSRDPGAVIAEVLRGREREMLDAWMELQKQAGLVRPDLIAESELREQSREFLTLVTAAAETGHDDIRGAEWTPVRDLVTQLSRSWAVRGFTPSETARFVFSFKQPLFDALQEELGTDAASLAAALWRATRILDELGLITTETFQRSREDVIRRHQQELLELSTPVVKLWEGILALPLIGTLDSARTQTLMDILLSRIVETGAALAIIDITGVPTVDTLVAQNLIKTLSAARLMGADCIISGLRPQIAQTMVQLGIHMEDVTTKATLADAFAVALKRSGYTVSRQQNASPGF